MAGLRLILCLLLGDDRLQAFGLQVAIFDLLQPVLDEGVGGVVLIKNFTLGLGLESFCDKRFLAASLASIIFACSARRLIFSPGWNSPVKVSEIGDSAKSSLTPLRSSASRVNINNKNLVKIWNAAVWQEETQVGVELLDSTDDLCFGKRQSKTVEQICAKGEGEQGGGKEVRT